MAHIAENRTRDEPKQAESSVHQSLIPQRETRPGSGEEVFQPNLRPESGYFQALLCTRAVAGTPEEAEAELRLNLRPADASWTAYTFFVAPNIHLALLLSISMLVRILQLLGGSWRLGLVNARISTRLSTSQYDIRSFAMVAGRRLMAAQEDEMDLVDVFEDEPGEAIVIFVGAVGEDTHQI
ncbi:MAG: hypothetical protein Q9181_003792 [Wetmoreana brouardii]